jgi:hypothetical protein
VHVCLAGGAPSSFQWAVCHGDSPFSQRPFRRWSDSAVEQKRTKYTTLFLCSTNSGKHKHRRHAQQINISRATNMVSTLINTWQVKPLPQRLNFASYGINKHSHALAHEHRGCDRGRNRRLCQNHCPGVQHGGITPYHTILCRHLPIHKQNAPCAVLCSLNCPHTTFIQSFALSHLRDSLTRSAERAPPLRRPCAPVVMVRYSGHHVHRVCHTAAPLVRVFRLMVICCERMAIINTKYAEI